MNKKSLINTAIKNNLTIKNFYNLLITHYNFNILDAIELTNEYEHELNKSKNNK